MMAQDKDSLIPLAKKRTYYIERCRIDDELGELLGDITGHLNVDKINIVRACVRHILNNFTIRQLAQMINDDRMKALDLINVKERADTAITLLRQKK